MENISGHEILVNCVKSIFINPDKVELVGPKYVDKPDQTCTVAIQVMCDVSQYPV